MSKHHRVFLFLAMLSKQAIEEFQNIYLKTFGVAVSFSEASSQAENLLRLYKALLKPSINKGSHNDTSDHTTTIT